MAKKREPVDDVLDAIVWMRRKSKRREAVDDFIDALLAMRRKSIKLRKKAGKRPRAPSAPSQVKVKTVPLRRAARSGR